MAKTNIGTAYVQILPTTEGIKNQLTKAMQGPMDSVGRSAGRTMGKALSGALKATVAAGAAAMAAGAAAVGAVLKQAVSSYADYEQLLGGVDKLFGAASDAVLQHAEEAYRTAGLSANQYMEAVTGFSASLISGLGGDTAEAARVADIAIQDMADNANTFGTDMASIQAAYQGFVKQNYTMLDNLKLGYGGTAAEMARLINESGVLQGEFEATAENVKDIPYDIIIQAIHTTQEEMGIAGTTAKEAAKTISGSFGMLKGAWSNLLTGLADPNADLDKLFDNFIEAAETWLDNLLPVVQRALTGMAKLIGKLAPTIARELPKLIQSVLPALIKAAGDLVAGLAAALPELLDTLLDAAGEVIDTLLDGLVDHADEIGETAAEIVTRLATFLIEHAPELLTGAVALITSLVNGISEHIEDIVTAINAAIGAIVDWLANPDNLLPLLGAAVHILVALAKGLISGIVELTKKLPELIQGIVEWFQTPGNLDSLAEGALEILEALGAAILELGSVLWNIGADIVNGIWTGIKEAWPSVVNWISNALDWLADPFGINADWEDLLTFQGAIKAYVENQPSSEFFGAGRAGSLNSTVPNHPSSTRSDAIRAAQQSSDWRSGIVAGAVPATNSYNIDINVTGAEAEDEDLLAQRIAYEISCMLDRRFAAYA